MHAGFAPSTSVSANFNSKMDDILSKLDSIKQNNVLK